MTLSRLALARGTLDRAAHLRDGVHQDAEIAVHPDRAVVVLAGDRLLIATSAQGLPRLAVDARIELDAEHLLVFLGQDDERPYWAALYPAEAAEDLAMRRGWAGRTSSGLISNEMETSEGEISELGDGELGDGELGDGEVGDGEDTLNARGLRWAALREVGTLLDDEHAGLAVTAVGLAVWHTTHRFCPSCGGLTQVSSAGWSRSCERCAMEHFPRTDPAVIMSVIDPEGRILLGRQRTWAEHRYSTLAGFVEVGESLEAAVRREVLEEAGIRVGAVTYLGSQPWPFPRSLMLGFTAEATSTMVTVDDTELAEARWWTHEQFTKDVAAGDLLLPPAISISHRLIEHWYGADLPATPHW
jgi:NAD+ diphosphatase